MNLLRLTQRILNSTKRQLALLCVVVFWPAHQAHAEIVSALQSSYAFTLASISGIDQRSESYAMGFDVRWLSFRSRILAATGEFNYAKSGLYNRAAYQQTKIGVQYYPFGLGANFEDTYESAILRYDSFFKPYFGGSFGFGRFFLKPIDSVAAAELSADYLIPSGALGTTLQFSKDFSGDVALDAGFAIGNSSVAFSALLMRVRIGLLMAM